MMARRSAVSDVFFITELLEAILLKACQFDMDDTRPHENEWHAPAHFIDQIHARLVCKTWNDVVTKSTAIGIVMHTIPDHKSKELPLLNNMFFRASDPLRPSIRHFHRMLALVIIKEIGPFCFRDFVLNIVKM
jgi:hypothetical protein